jgi:hypothetical protein
VTKKFAGKGCSGWRMVGGIFLTVTHGDDSRLATARIFRYTRIKEARWGFQEFLRGVVVLLGRSVRNRSCWMPRTYGRSRQGRIGSLRRLLCEPQGPPVHGISLHCSCACAAETRSAHLRSLLQDRCAWLHLRCAASALLPHQRPPACMRMVGCLAYARVCGNEPSRPSVLRRVSDLRRAAPASASAWVEGARRAWLHRGSSELVASGCRLRFVADVTLT